MMGNVRIYLRRFVILEYFLFLFSSLVSFGWLWFRYDGNGDDGRNGRDGRNDDESYDGWYGYGRNGRWNRCRNGRCSPHGTSQCCPCYCELPGCNRIFGGARSIPSLSRLKAARDRERATHRDTTTQEFKAQEIRETEVKQRQATRSTLLFHFLTDLRPFESLRSKAQEDPALSNKN